MLNIGKRRSPLAVDLTFQTGAPAQGGTCAYDAQNRLASRTVTSGTTTTTTLYIHDLKSRARVRLHEAAGMFERAAPI